MKPKRMNRKEALERVHLQVHNLSMAESWVAWKALMERVFELADPARPGGPKFVHLMTAIYKAGLKGKGKREIDEFLSDGEAIPSEDQDRDEAARLAIPENRRSDNGSPKGHGPKKG